MSDAVTGEWTNWSESLRFTPATFERPEREEEVSDLLRRAAGEGQTVRPVGAGHSSSALVETPDVLVSLERMSGLLHHDSGCCEVTVGAGSPLQDLGHELHGVGLALENYGDVDLQVIGGAVGTGTHGTGKGLGCFSSTVIGARMVAGNGEAVDVGEHDLDLLRAVRVSLGALGILTELRLRVRPAFRLHRREWCVHIDDCMAHLDRLIEENRNFDFYWHPRRDEAQLRALNVPGEEPHELFEALPPTQGVRKDEEGWSFEIIPRARGLKFEEMEYMLPRDAFRSCFEETRARIIERHRQYVGWRLLCRTIAADEDFLSPYHGRETMTISLHQNNTLPWRGYFEDLEPIFRDHGGRPHWGKKHNLAAAELRPLYPMWDSFARVRERMDPGGVLLNSHLRQLLVGDPGERRAP